MGAYLSEPLTTKNSSDEANNFLASGSSSMQGWRISQEDAHNCILTFDTNTSFFAVYDGHGGSEVAQYCSIHLPTFLKKLSAYKAKDFEQALKDAFIGFDATLLSDKVIEELKKLSDKSNGEDEAIEEDEEEDEDDNVDDLCKEACMPLNEVLQMYKKDKKNPAISKLKEGNSSKPVSPFLKGKRKDLTSDPAEEAAAGPSSSNAAGSSSAEADASSSKNESTPDAADSTVSSSSTKTSESSEVPESSTASDEKKAADQSDEISDTAGKVTKQECAPDSSSKAGEDDSKDSKPVVNGDAAESKAVSSSSSSASAAQENGVGSSNSAAGGSSASGSAVDSSSAGSSSAAAATTPKGRKAKNGAALATPVDDSDDDDTETDEEFPPVADANETSSTEDGEEDPYCEEGSEEEEDEDEGEGDYDEEDYMNEEDEAFMNNITDEPGKDSGCTAVVALLHEKDLYVANAGDSRCVVCRNGKALEMSFDHKPEDQIEFDRIQKAGGRVTLDGRVNGGLNLSRAIGDHGYKMNKKLPPEEQMISALPDIKKITIGPEDEFMVLACDGIWNFMTSDDVVEFVQERIADPTKKLSEICEEMFDYCLAPHTKGDGTGCDNMTAIIVKFQSSLTGGASRKRAASPEPETTASESDCKKVKTEEAKSSTNGGGGASDEKEAAAAVATIAEPATSEEDAAASSST
ncbi:probable protein phosphatase CG10417 [Culex quinquefasciatus]|uniref:probable protein phosphatase CG10417 n=1 Tax=Culex quinquefasciatus TaxID=7176 RepID=UPI0018E39DE6|nr:probable protein phosphatase CG10417 [Culex quinquefasciatus]